MWKSMDDEDGEEVSCQEQEKMLTPTVLVSRRRKILEVTRLPTMYCVKKCVQQAADVNKVSKHKVQKHIVYICMLLYTLYSGTGAVN